MPESQQPERGTNLILSGVLSNPKRSILDIGAGEGKWGKRLKGKVPLITGVEVWTPYIERYGLKSHYDHLIQDDIMNVPDETLSRFDVAIMGDILEHLSKDDAVSIINRLKKNMKEIYLSIPVTVCIQGAANGNPFEEHKYHWSDKEIRYDLGFEILNFGVNDNGLVCVGTYRWRAP